MSQKIKNFGKLIINTLREFYYRFISTPSQVEKILILKLRKQILALPKLGGQATEFDLWTIHRDSIRKSILQKDPRFFLNWPEITYTMFHSARKEELIYLNNLPNWTEWKRYLAESPVGNPKLYPLMPETSGNLIHYAYAFARFIENTKFDFLKANIIFEFGGGYGGMARLAYKMGFKGTYVIFDLPEFLCIQEYFLESSDPELKISRVPVVNQRTVVLLSEAVEVQKFFSQSYPDLIIGSWSLSESPISLRNEILQYGNDASSFLIAFQSQFEGVNNLDYFSEMSKRYPTHRWQRFHIDHLPNNYYLFGTGVR